MVWRLTRGSVSLLLIVGSILGAGAWMPAEAQATTLVAHDPILIEGDSDLCNVEDLQGAEDAADGIVNCDTADGSEARPYVIRGWNITWNPAEGCRIAPNPAICSPLPPCSLTSVPAALAVCGTRKHVRIEQLVVWNGEVAREIGSNTLGGVRIPAAAIAASNVDNLALDAVAARGGGIALFIEAGKPVPTLPPRGDRPVVITNLDARAWFENAENSVLGPVPDDESLTSFPELSIVRIADVPVVLNRAHVNAVTRDTGLSMNATDPALRLEITDSVFGNTSANYGLQLFDVDSVIERNQFINNGVAGQGVLDTGAIRFVRGTTMTRHNQFFLEGGGISVVSPVTGIIRENRFYPANPAGESMQNIALVQDANGDCGLRFAYNDIPGLVVRNDAEDCVLDARYNWWNGQPMTEGEGQTITTPALPAALADLPRVRITGPAPDAQVHGKVLIHGTVEPAEGLTVQRIEGSLVEADWVKNQTTGVSASTWSLTWDLAGIPLGRTVLFFRACGSRDDCGPPTRLDLVIIERPLPPIALLQAEPRIATVNQSIRLDASYSYSPQERPLVAYRFELGNGEVSAWQPQPTFDVRYAEPGEYAVSVQVQDLQGLISENLPQTIVRIQEDESGRESGTPSTSVLVAGLVIAALALLQRRRT